MREQTIITSLFWINGFRTNIELARYDDGRLALTGEHDGHAGQCQYAIEVEAGDVSDELNAVLTIWEENHLKVTPDSIFDRCKALLAELDGQRIGDTPDLDDAPEIEGDVIDSRDVIKALEIYRQAVIVLGIPESEVDTFTHENWPVSAPEDMDSDDEAVIDEFLALRDFHDAGEGYAGDWTFGATIIAESYFTEYAKEMCEDIGDLPRDLPGYLAIDWEKTAENLKVDYTEIEYKGETYLVR